MSAREHAAGSRLSGAPIARFSGGSPVPIVVDRYACASASFSPPAAGLAQPRAAFDPSRSVNIAIVNNMPDAAMEATSRQYLSLLAAAARNLVVNVRLFSMPGVPSSGWRRAHVSARYFDFHTLFDAPVDGLIVTGTEPRAADLADEPYWPDLRTIVDWAQESTTSAVFSCLAAHAAVLHLDAIGRTPLGEKRFGLFEHTRVGGHFMVRGQGERILTPHSRWNDIPGDALVAAGYRVVSQSPAAGVDMFVKDRKKSLFVFFQGHPEYEPDTLAREYRRDVGRFLRFERDTYPELPRRYFAPPAVAALNAFRERAGADRNAALLAAFPARRVFAAVPRTWHAQALRTYHNWLAHIAERKASAHRLRPSGRPPSRKRAVR